MLAIPHRACVFLLAFLFYGCGNSGSSSGGFHTPSDDEPTEIPTTLVSLTGSGVKGPLALAEVDLYAVDYTSQDLRGELIESGSTDESAAITGIVIPSTFNGKVLLEFNVTSSTIDITSGTAPSFTQLVTVVDASRIIAGDAVYASLLTTMAVELALTNADSDSPYGGNSDNAISAEEFSQALDIAQDQIKSTVGFGLNQDVDVFSVPPLITDMTDTQQEQQEVAAYRQANEALAAIVTKVAEESAADDSPQTILSALTVDLADGEINAQNGDITVAALSTLEVPIETTISTTDPSALLIPGTEVLISDIEIILSSETETTQTSTDTTALEDGTISVEPEMASINTDTDFDGVNDTVDAFPADPNETVDTDEDGVGDNGDVFPEDPLEWADSDNDSVGDNADIFPLDPTETLDTDNDGVGNNSDAFPADPNETADTDQDGVGNNADAFPDDPTRSEIDNLFANFWVGLENTEISINANLDNVQQTSSSQVDCNTSNILSCENGNTNALTTTSTNDTSTTTYQEGFHHVSQNEMQVEIDVGVQRWVRRTHTAVLTFKDRIWIIGGYDGINDGVPSESENPNEQTTGDFDGFLAEDIWSSQDGNTWVRVSAAAPFGPRSYHKVVEFNGKMWLVGGSTYNQQTQFTDFLNDVWSSSDGKNWTLETQNAAFTPRRDHALVVFDDKMWVVGGTGTDFVGKNDVWYTENGVDWIQATENAGFREQDYPRIVNFNNKLWLVGGSGMYNQVWSSADGTNWTQEESSNYADLTRNTYGVTVHDNKIWIASGFSNDGYLNDVWYSEDGITYTEVPLAEGHYFSKRANANLLSFNDRLWMIGGRRSSLGTGDILSTSDGAAWFRHTFGPEELYPRTGHSFVAFNNKLFSFAGLTYFPHSQIWSSENGLNWQQETANSPFENRHYHQTVTFKNKLWVIGGMDRPGDAAANAQNDVWSSTDGINWTQESEAAEFAIRQWHKVVEWNGKLWLSGGYSSAEIDDLNDIWSSEDGVNWTLVTSDAPFAKRSRHGMFVFNNKLWILGGTGTIGFARHTDIWSSEDGENWTLETDDAPGMFNPRDTGVRMDFLTYVHNNKIFLWGGQDSADFLSDVWSSSDGVNWTLENSNTGIPGRSGSAITYLDGYLWLHGGGWQDGLAFFQKDVWRSSDGINWRAGFTRNINSLLP